MHCISTIRIAAISVALVLPSWAGAPRPARAAPDPPALSRRAPDESAARRETASPPSSSWFSDLFGSAADGGSSEIDCTGLEPFYGWIIDTIAVAGNERTRSVTIIREMASRRGAVLEERLVRRDASFLRGLGYFTDVRLDACESAPGRCRLTVTVVERPRLFMIIPYPVVNYDFEDGLSYGVNWRVKNFRGLGEDIYLSAAYKPDREQGGNFVWNVPWVGGRRLRLRAELYNYRRLVEPGRMDHVERQDIGSIGVGVPLSRSIVRQLWLKSAVTIEWRNASLFPSAGAAPLCGDVCRQTFLSAGAELELDSRDDRTTPFRGMLGRVRFRRFTAVSGVEQDYIFYSFSNYVYLPVGEGRSFVVAVDGDIREGDVPRFYELGLGGVRDLRGYDGGSERAVVKLLGTIQWRWRFFGPRIFRIPKIGNVDLTLNHVAFVDTGSLTDSILDLDSRRFHSTAGFGFEIISPLRDLVRLEMAGNGRDKPVFYMTTGTRF